MFEAFWSLAKKRCRLRFTLLDHGEEGEAEPQQRAIRPVNALSCGGPLYIFGKVKGDEQGITKLLDKVLGFFSCTGAFGLAFLDQFDCAPYFFRSFYSEKSRGLGGDARFTMVKGRSFLRGRNEKLPRRP